MTDRLARVAVFGGVYSNHMALAQTICDATDRGVDAIYCLGDLGAFGPSPDKVFPLLRGSSINVMRGNYDDSIGRGLSDYQCGNTDPRDNYFDQLSYEYTFSNTASENREWLAQLPHELRFQLGDLKVLCCHGSPRQMDEPLWESATPTHFLDKLTRDYDCDIILGTHTGIHWSRRIGTSQWYVNVGAIGRPANDGRTAVWYAIVAASGKNLNVEFVPLTYDYLSLADEMRDENLPEEFITTICTGWWTTCLEVLPARERARGRF
jgi:predicted phosphodiesterase